MISTPISTHIGDISISVSKGIVVKLSKVDFEAYQQYIENIGSSALFLRALLVRLCYTDRQQSWTLRTPPTWDECTPHRIHIQTSQQRFYYKNLQFKHHSTRSHLPGHPNVAHPHRQQSLANQTQTIRRWSMRSPGSSRRTRRSPNSWPRSGLRSIIYRSVVKIRIQDNFIWRTNDFTSHHHMYLLRFFVYWKIIL